MVWYADLLRTRINTGQESVNLASSPIRQKFHYPSRYGWPLHTFFFYVWIFFYNYSEVSVSRRQSLNNRVGNVYHRGDTLISRLRTISPYVLSWISSPALGNLPRVSRGYVGRFREQWHSVTLTIGSETRPNLRQFAKSWEENQRENWIMKLNSPLHIS